ncbi:MULTISPECIES: hypothetical protein [Cupriavidus]
MNTATAPEPFAATVHPLRIASPFIDPLWFTSTRGRTFDAVVASNGALQVEGETLRFAEQTLPPGTAVRITVARWITCVTHADWARATAAREAARAAQAAAEQAHLDALRADAETFNARLQLPVKWTSAIKDVLSGLSATSWGDGRNRATANHILLLEDLQAGNLRRHAADFLCTAASASNGRRYSSPEREQSDGEGRSFAPKITCKRCLELAKRWTAE